MLGAIIFAVLSRSRWSDLRFVDQFWVERAEFNGQLFGFVEARTKFPQNCNELGKETATHAFGCAITGGDGC